MKLIILIILIMSAYLSLAQTKPNVSLSIETAKNAYVSNDTLCVKSKISNNEMKKVKLFTWRKYRYTTPNPYWKLCITNKKGQRLVTPIKIKQGPTQCISLSANGEIYVLFSIPLSSIYLEETKNHYRYLDIPNDIYTIKLKYYNHRFKSKRYVANMESNEIIFSYHVSASVLRTFH